MLSSNTNLPMLDCPHSMKSRFALFVCMILGIQGFASIAQAKTPDDTFYFKQWYLQQIRAEEAWEKTTGSKQVVVAVIDTTVDIDHEDLRGNIWTNPNEVAGNGIDDDGNGFIDDIHGWNFVDDSAELRPNAEDRQEAFVHGTLVASLIGAEGNNSRGIAGVAWHVSIMPLVGLDASGSGSTVDVANAVNYAVLHGADIINLSIEGHLRDPLLDEAIAFARSRGVLTVAAAGNSAYLFGSNLDEMPVYPACLAKEGFYGVISVSGTDQADAQAPYANYGSCVDLSAPGTDFFGARPPVIDDSGAYLEPGYAGGYSGTSLAAPLVSGVAALLKSAHPSWGATELRNHLLSHSAPLQDSALGAGRLDAALALADIVPGSIKESLELRASMPGQPTRIQLWADAEILEFAPFGPEDMRGARAAFTDMDGDGSPEIIAVPATGSAGDWALYGRDGQEIRRGIIGMPLKNGAVAAGVRNGFVLADPNGGMAWGYDRSFAETVFYPFGKTYAGGMDMLGVSDAAAFVPSNGTGHLAITDAAGNLLVNVFPFGTAATGRWSLARMTIQSTGFLVMSGPLGSLRLDDKKLGKDGWIQATLDDLATYPFLTSSGFFTEDPLFRRYDTWPH